MIDDLPAKSAIFEIQSDLREIEENASLYEEKNFEKRIEVIDFIGFQIMDRVEELQRMTTQPDKRTGLRYRAEKVKSQLEEIDSRLFQRLRTTIRKKGCRGNEFKDLINEYIDLTVDYNKDQEETGYDNLDLFINGLTLFQHLPEQTKELEPEMVFYQKTPARVVFELVERSLFSKEDVFFDLGSGLGQVAILVNLLAGVTAKGIECEPAFCDYARDCAAELNLSDVTFLNVDARKADYAGGTIFFMYTPFRGEILEEVLEALRKESLRRKITLITYGPCTVQVALQSWLHCTTPANNSIYKLSIFSNF
jgi:SAM-dependent methyltransferase